MELHTGDNAPDFTLPSNHGPQALASYRGQWLVLYYYPKDFTSGCTAEACDFRDLHPTFNTINATVLGVSADDIDSHTRFANEHALPFLLLSDENNEVAKRYGSYGEKTVAGKTYEGTLRSTFIIDPNGKIAEAMVNVRSDGHAERVAKRLAELQAGG